MSHTVFRDLDEDKTSDNCSKGDIAENNLIVFINKDGDVQVDPNALQDLIVNANTDTKSTVSVIRLGSPTPSMDTEEDDSSTKQSDGDDEKNSDEEHSNSESETDEDSDEDDADSDGGKKKKKKKNKVPRIGMTVENFFNPQQAIEFATEIMNIAGITNPKQLKADYEHLRYIIKNDHCYTPYTYADSLAEGKTDETSDSAKRDGKKLKAPVSSTQGSTTKKVAGRSSLSKATPSNGLDKDTSSSSRNRSVDDAMSSTENRSSEEEEAESETDFSDMSDSESDNDRDSDLDFSVNDCHSRRAKKIKKRKIKTKKAASKKARRNTVDFTGSDDGATPNRKKAKLPKKVLNTSAKSPSVSTPPATTSTTPKVQSVSTPSPAPRITKITYVKDCPQLSPVVNIGPKLPTIQKVGSTTPLPTVENKPKIIIMRHKEKKPQQENAVDTSSLFKPDVVKKNANENVSMVGPQINTSTPRTVPQVVKMIPMTSVAPVVQPVVHSFVHQNTPKIYTTKLIRSPMVTVRRLPNPKPTLNLASEQDKQLDLIDSLVQEELNRTEPETATSNTSVIPAAIPNIVKMLETSHTTPIDVTDLPVSSTSNLPITYTTTSSVSDSQMLPDDLLESFVNSEYLSDDLMQHVAKLVDDKNLADVIDQQLGVDPITTCTEPAPQLTPIVQKPIIIPVTPTLNPITPTKPLEEQKSIVNFVKPTITPNVTPTNKEPIKVIRSGGRIITLPPIEAPATRAAKRRAETTPGSEQKHKVFTVIVQTDSPITPKSVPNSPTPQQQNKAKPITPRERRASLAVKRTSIDKKTRRSMSISNPPATIDDDDDDEDGSDGSYNSEDDPHRLWCICQQPHNNRFMICCDKCEEWFHGKCVGITRQMGREMEERQSEWICPNCEKKLQPSIKNIFPRKLSLENTPAKAQGTAGEPSDGKVPNCIVCSVKASRTNSVYCSDDCIRKHAITTKGPSEDAAVQLKSPPDAQKKSIQPKIFNQMFKDKLNHVVVFDKVNNKYLTGKNAPTTNNLQQWLSDHPNHEVLKPGTPQAQAFKAKQLQLKQLAKEMEAERELFSVTQTAKIQTKLRFDSDKITLVNPTTQKQATTAVKRPHSSLIASSSPVGSKTPKLTATPVQKVIMQKKRTPDVKPATQSKSDSSSGRNSERDRLRDNARKTLIEQLIIRTKEINDPNAIKLTESQITEFVTAAELELFEMNGNDTNMKYKSKYRSLMYNIRDRKNLTLFEKISCKLIEPKQLVRMTTEELSSQELAKWRENENKHQLEIITKSELDMLACGNSYVLKTHKGEEVIQESTDRITLDPLIPVQDLVSVLNSSAVSSSDTKDIRVDKYLTPDGKSSSSVKRDSERSHEKKERHDSRSSGSSSKHKRKRSRDRHSSSHSHSHSHKDRSHDKDRKERSSESRKDKRDHKSSGSSSSSSSRSKQHDKDRKRESVGKVQSTPKIAKPDENSIIDKIRKAQSTIDSILHPEEFKKTNESANPSEANVLVRQPSLANESDQEPTSTVTIPSPPAITPQRSSSAPSAYVPNSEIIWSGNINMIDVATFQVSLSVLSGTATTIDFPKEFDVVGRINPETVWDYLEKIRISKEIILLRFSPMSSSDDDETAYSTFISYLDTRTRLGVIKVPSKMVKDFYILPLTSHKSLPTILKTTTGFDLGADRPDLLLGIIVRNRPSQSSNVIPPKPRQNIPFIGHKPVLNVPIKEVSFSPESSPNINQAPNLTKQIIKSYSANLDDDDDEPYSPGGSDEDDLSLSTSYLTSSTTNPVPDYAKSLIGPTTSHFDHEKLLELNRQIEAEKKQIAMLDIDEPYSPTSSVSPPLNANLSDVGLSNISIPANLADILNKVASFGSSSQMPINQYGAMVDNDTEYVPVASGSAAMSYAPAPALMQSNIVSSQPSELAQLTDEELLRLVPDEI